MSRVAAVDCGTNSIRLLVTEIDTDAGEQQDLERRLRIVRLGQGVDATGRLADEALERTMDALTEYVGIIEQLGAEHVRMVATSATRDASNAQEFVAGVRAILGVDPEVVTGDEEAELAFAGATRELGSAHPGPYLVVDIGGGSTELVAGRDGLDAARSIDIGSVRVTERHFADDPPMAEQVSAARADIETALEAAADAVPIRDAGTLIGLAGTITTIGAIHLGLAEYDSSKVHHARLPARAVAEISDRLLAASHDERAAISVIHPGRRDVIAAGSLILRCVVERSDIGEVLVSERDILDGIAWSVAG